MADLNTNINIVVKNLNKLKSLKQELKDSADYAKAIQKDFERLDNLQKRSRRVLKPLDDIGRDVPRDAKGRFTKDPNRKRRQELYQKGIEKEIRLEQRLQRIRQREIGTNTVVKQEIAHLKGRVVQQRLENRELQVKIQRIAKLKAAQGLVSRKLREAGSAGLSPTEFGGTEGKRVRGRRSALNEEVQNIRTGFESLRSAGVKNIETYRALGSQLSRTVEELNALNKASARRSVGFEKGRRLQERIDTVAASGYGKTSQIAAARESAANVIAAGKTGDQNLYNQALSKATAQVSRLERAYKEAETVQKKASQQSKKAQRRLRNIRKIRQDRNDRMRESLMLGAGFPLLFGGGVGAVAGGVGGALAQRGGKGFGAQILFSAIGQQFDQLVTTMVASTARLGKALTAFGQNIEEVTKAAGLSNTAEAVRIKLIEEARGKQAAFNAAVNELNNVVGVNGVNALKKFGEATNNLANAWSKLMSSIFARLAIAAEKMGITDGLNNIADNFSAPAKKRSREQFLMSPDKSQELTSKFSQQRGIEAQLSSFGAGTQLPDGEGYSAKIEQTRLGLTREQYEEVTKLRAEYQKINEEVNKLADKEIEAFVRKEKTLLVTEAATKDLTKNTEYIKDALKFGEREANIKKEVEDRVKQIKDAHGDTVDINRKAIEANVRDNQAWKEKLEIVQQIKNTLATGLTDAIMSVIDKTKTLGEALGQILKQIARILIQKAMMSLIDKIPFGGGGVASGGTSAMVAADNAMYGNTFPAGSFSKGGLVTRPTIGLIGEAGEDEYIIPSSKMQGAMERYSAGARGQAVIPGGGTVASGSGVSSTPTVVNYTGPVLSFNSEAYVPKSAIPEIINSAARRGAEEGQSKVFSQLKNSRSRRSKIGL